MMKAPSRSARAYEQRRNAETDLAVERSGKGFFHIGDVGVDTAQVMICDPCNGSDGICSVVVPSGHGDGNYPVYARYQDGVVAEVRIMFLKGEKP
jgi:hypothetical protein